jgi:hypothetical protein
LMMADTSFIRSPPAFSACVRRLAFRVGGVKFRHKKGPASDSPGLRVPAATRMRRGRGNHGGEGFPTIGGEA